MRALARHLVFVGLAGCQGALSSGGGPEADDTGAPADAAVDAEVGGDDSEGDAPRPLRPGETRATDAASPEDAGSDLTAVASPDGGATDAAVVAPDDAVVSPDAASLAPDAAALPECECFVRAAWCGLGASEAGLSRETPCRVPLVPGHEDDLLGCEDGRWVVLEACAFGCHAAPPGTPDTCNPDPDGPTPENPAWADCPHRALLAWGLHPEASDRLRCAGVSGDRITQTIGNAAASAGYHAEDGRVDGEPYCAAVDLSTRGLDQAEIRDLLDRLGRHGFAAWYRWPGHDGWPADEAPHIHAVFAGVRMKEALRGQVRDFLVDLNGLASHREYTFWDAPRAVLDLVRLLFRRFYEP